MSWTVATSSYGSRNYRLAVDIKVNSQSITNNSTTLYYRVYADNTGYSTTWVKYYTGTVVINGTTVYSHNSAKKGSRGQTFKTGTITVPHNSDGTKSISVSISSNIYSSSGNYKSGSQSISLPRIDRGIYDVSLASGWDKTTGAKTITYKKYNSNAKVQVVTGWWDYTTSKQSVYYRVLDSSKNLSNETASGATIYLQDEVINGAKKGTPNNWKGYLYVQLRVTLNGKRIQTITREIGNIIISEDKPNLTVVAEFTGRNQSLLGSQVRGLKGVHTLKLSLSSKMNGYANFKRYEIEFEGKTKTQTSSTVYLYPKSAGTKTVKVKVLDSRDWSATHSVTVTVLDYTPPQLEHKVFRVSGSSEDPVGTTGRVTGSVLYSTVKDTSGSNINSGWWRISAGTNTSSGYSSISFSMNVPINEERKFMLDYGDKFSEGSITSVIPLGYAPLSIDKTAVGVNMVPPRDGKGLYIGKDSKLHIGHKYFLEFVPSDPKLERNDALYIGRDDRQYGLALIWNKLYFIQDYKYYEMFRKEDLSSVDINTFTIPGTYVSSSYSDSFENEYILEQMYKKAPNGLSFHTYKQRSQGFVILYKYDNDTNATALFVRYGYLPGSYMRNGNNSWVQNKSPL